MAGAADSGRHLDGMHHRLPASSLVRSARAQVEPAGEPRRACGIARPQGQDLGAGWRLPDRGLVDAFAAALDRLTEGVLLVDAGARIVFGNAAAEALIRKGRGLGAANGILRAEAHRDTVALRRAIASCAHPETAACDRFLLLPVVEGPPLSVAIVPRQPGTKAAALEPVATVFIADPDRPALPSAEHLRKRFALTQAEAALAIQVLAGDGLEACGRRLGISTATARTHLRHVFQKTGTGRQAELVRVLLGVGLGALEA